MKKALCILLSAVVLLMLTACESNSTDVSVYENYAKNDAFLPCPEELSNYTSVHTLLHHGAALFFFWDAYHLIVGYDAAQYQTEKAALEEKYTFREEAICGEETGYVSRLPYCDMDGYHLRILQTDGLGFPKDVYFIGTNDEEHKIIYIRFYDSDLDTVDSLESFLCNECGWKELIKRGYVEESTPRYQEGCCWFWRF